MFKAIKDNKIIAISDTDSEFFCLVKDEVVEDTEHTVSDYAEHNGEYILQKDYPATEDKIAELKNQLSAMDYKTSKYVDGEYTEEEWAVIKSERQAIREQIRELENGM